MSKIVNSVLFVVFFVLLVCSIFAISPTYAKEHGFSVGTISPNKSGNISGLGNCYFLLGPKLKSTFNIEINPTNSGLSAEYIESATEAAIDELELYESGLFGSISINYDSNVDTSNAQIFIYFNENTSLVNIGAQIHYIYHGDKMLGSNIEFNAKDFEWGNYLQNNNILDYQGTLTHELGHAIGLGDVFEDGCEENTMFWMTDSYLKAYEHRTIETGDKKGLFTLYGNKQIFKNISYPVLKKEDVQISNPIINKRIYSKIPLKKPN